MKEYTKMIRGFINFILMGIVGFAMLLLAITGIGIIIGVIGKFLGV
jgi:hypothetical protein